MAMQLPDDFKEFLRLFRAHGVRHLVVGGWAVGLHGRPRSTQDLDIWIEVSGENARNASEALGEFGFAAPADLFLDRDSMVRMGRPPLRIEILNSVSGLDFGEAYGNSVEMELDGVPVRVLSLSDLRRNKAASGRHKDLDDLENLPIG
ncbi:MAG TPA: nucleotidyltransferase [Fibrobacteria bacterium]|nr:nucleotidyltransferase [Fibrobacteria bacterium]